MGVWNHPTSQGHGRKYSVTCDHHSLKSRFGIKVMISVVCNPAVCVVCMCLQPDTAPEGPISLWFVSHHSSDNQLICTKELCNHRDSLVLWSKMFERVFEVFQ